MVGRVVELTMLDITAPDRVEIEITKRVIWVNVDGMCRLRICRYHDLIIKGGEDERGSQT